MKKNILELKINNKDKDLEAYLKPQWSWKTLITIGLFIFKMNTSATSTPFIKTGKHKPCQLIMAARPKSALE